MAYKGIGERVYRFYLEETGAVVTGEVVGHRLYRCRGIRCARRISPEGGYGSAPFEAFLERCLARARSNCHTDLVVRFTYDGRPVEIEGQVTKPDFGQIAPGSPIAVLVNRDHPEKSLLCDHNPEGFLFWVALLQLAVVSLLAMVLLPRPSRSRRYPRR
ncbi:hypothetical protein I603_0557 [Erythrobacter dokdonensis DSW-74]|uniref:DUF3592 domain-containing protein n=2 Tax=Erythrobacter TaxID=1041 RepID=A0A1A7BL26_9SPHN|nr:hypothetical protein [Erythrobacter dokdonensis]OBV12426.1 hypothetical protein I603_0557 [Erythrobacter dokdonensis DSW-74]